ncbi:MAG: hypothetical protein FWH19_04575 [Treponema sp.]|nr:hypothetical protein [Treponema sp.]
MKRFVLILLVFVLASASAFAFDIMQYPPTVESGDFLLNAGVGFGSFGATSWHVKIPPIAVSLEYCLDTAAPISVGGMVSFLQYGWDYLGGQESWTHTFIIFAGRANWHWNFDVDWLDFYTGLSLGYQYFNAEYSGPDQLWLDRFYDWNYGGFYWAGQLGARFFFSQKIGAVAEFGYPMLLKAGITFKF